MSVTLEKTGNSRVQPIPNSESSAVTISIQSPSPDLASTISRAQPPIEFCKDPAPNFQVPTRGSVMLPGTVNTDQSQSAPKEDTKRRESHLYDHSVSRLNVPNHDEPRVSASQSISTLNGLEAPPLVAIASVSNSSSSKNSAREAPADPNRRVSHSRTYSISRMTRMYRKLGERHNEIFLAERYFRFTGKHLDIKNIDKTDFRQTLAKVLQVVNINYMTAPFSMATCREIRDLQKEQESGKLKVIIDSCLGISTLTAYPLNWLQKNQNYDFPLGAYIGGGIAALGIFIICKVFGDRIAEDSRTAKLNLRTLIGQQKKELEEFGQQIINWWGLATCQLGNTDTYDPVLLEEIGITKEMQTQREYLQRLLLTNVFPKLCVYFGVDLEEEYQDVYLPDDVLAAWRLIKINAEYEFLQNHFERTLLGFLKIPRYDVEEMLVFPRDALKAIFDEVKTILLGSTFDPPKSNVMAARLTNFRIKWQADVRGKLAALKEMEKNSKTVQGPIKAPRISIASDAGGDQNSSTSAASTTSVRHEPAVDSLRSRVHSAAAKRDKLEHKVDPSDEKAPASSASAQARNSEEFITVRNFKPVPVGTIDQMRFGTVVGKTRYSKIDSRSIFYSDMFTPPQSSNPNLQAPAKKTSPRDAGSIHAPMSIPAGSKLSSGVAHSGSANKRTEHHKASETASDDTGWDFSPIQSPKISPKLGEHVPLPLSQSAPSESSESEKDTASLLIKPSLKAPIAAHPHHPKAKPGLPPISTPPTQQSMNAPGVPINAFQPPARKSILSRNSSSAVKPHITLSTSQSTGNLSVLDLSSSKD